MKTTKRNRSLAAFLAALICALALVLSPAVSTAYAAEDADGSVTALTTGVVVDVTIEAGGTANFSFEPSDSGFYALSVTTDSAVGLVEVDSWFFYDQTYANNDDYVIYIPSSETIYICVENLDDAASTFSVEVTSASVSLTQITSLDAACTVAASENPDTVYVVVEPTVNGRYYFTVEPDAGVSSEPFLFNEGGVVIGCEISYSDSGYVISADLVGGMVYYLGFYLHSTGAEDGYSPSVTVTVSSDAEGADLAGTSVTRLAGSNRYETMAAIVAAAYAGESCSVAVLVTGTDFPDALAAASLAGALDAPIVLVSDGKADVALEVLEELGVSEVVIVGGTSAVSMSVQSQVEALGIEVIERYSGANRYETAIEVAWAVKVQMGASARSQTCIVASGSAFPDALSISPYAYWTASPIYLAKKDGSLSDEVLAAIEEIGYERVIVVGGTSAVSEAAEDELEALGVEVIRLGGANRYETSALVAAWSVAEGMSYDGAAVATGTSFPDALAGATLCGRSGSVLLLAREDRTAALELLADDGADVGEVYILGGTSAVSESLEEALAAMLAG